MKIISQELKEKSIYLEKLLIKKKYSYYAFD